MKLFGTGLFELQKSIIRRSLIVLFLVAPGFVLNYGLLYGAGRLLPIESFGIFYTAISIINVLFAPAVILGFFYSRQITQQLSEVGLAQALVEFREFVRQLLRWGAIATAGLFGVLALAGSILGGHSFLLIAFIALATFASYLTEAVRAGLQGLQKFIWLGIAGLVWMTLRFGFGMTGVYLGGTAWAGVAGIFLSTMVVFFGFYAFIVGHAPAGVQSMPATPVKLRSLLLFMTGFGFFAAIMYLDILGAYLILDRVELGIYSASSILPKAIVILSMPIVQVLFPVMVGDRSAGQIRPSNFLKGFILTLIVSAAGGAVLFIFADYFCTSPIGIKSCHTDLLVPLLASGIAISLLRVLVLLQLARGLDWHPLGLLVPVAAYAAYVALESPGIGGLAYSYVVFSWLTLGVYAVACLPWSFVLRQARGAMRPEL